jgi:hypothetical protein
MELIYVIPADAAETSANGKFSLLGGGIETIFAPIFPVIHPRLALVVKLRALSPEVEQDHTFRVDIIGPNDFHVTPEARVEFRTGALPSEPDRPITFTLVMNMSSLVFPEPGMYLGHLYVDSQEVGTFPLGVQKHNPHIDEVSST